MRAQGRAWTLALGLLVGLVAMAATPRPAVAVTPIVNCMEPNLSAPAGNYFVYFGYVNTGVPVNIENGDQNQVIPGFGFQGQPTVFNTGSYPRVFRATFNTNVFSAIAWELDGIQAIATPTTQRCVVAVTGSVSDLSTTGATLNGLVHPGGVDTAYYFNYGQTTTYGQATPERHAASASALPVSEAITGLMPDTTYHYQLVASGLMTTAGEDRTFTTPALPEPPAPTQSDLVLTRSGPLKAKIGKKRTVTFSVANLGPVAATGVQLTVRVGKGLRVLSMGAPGGPCGSTGQIRTCPVGGIPPGGSAAVTAVLSPRRGGRIPYNASVAGDQPETRAADNVVDGTLRGRGRAGRYR